jgi:GrpB-like predicted nucleotidyltransferase (UPF0157 family)
VTLKTAQELAPLVEIILREISAELGALLPRAEFHHIGATALPHALTKGDIDVLLRVPAGEFAPAVEVLRRHFAIKQPENWDPFFASFGRDSDYALPLGVQLVVKDSEADFFLFIHDYFVSHPDRLAEYNRLKSTACTGSAADYWAAKNRLLASIVALRKAPAQTTL